jgi:hypothetical protein
MFGILINNTSMNYYFSSIYMISIPIEDNEWDVTEQDMSSFNLLRDQLV